MIFFKLPDHYYQELVGCKSVHFLKTSRKLDVVLQQKLECFPRTHILPLPVFTSPNETAIESVTKFQKGIDISLLAFCCLPLVLVSDIQREQDHSSSEIVEKMSNEMRSRNEKGSKKEWENP